MNSPAIKKRRGPYRRWMEPNAEGTIPRQTLHNDKRLENKLSSAAASTSASVNGHPDQALTPRVPPSTSHEADDDCGGMSGEHLDCSSVTSDDTEEEPCDVSENEDDTDCETEFQTFLGGYSDDTLPHQDTTKGQAMLLILIYVVTAGLTWSQVDGLLSLINALFGSDILPRSKYLFRKIWKKRQEHILRLHYFCAACFAHLGSSAKSAKGRLFICPLCHVHVTQERLLSSGSFFVLLDIKKRLQMLLKNVGATLLNHLSTLASRSSAEERYSDITDGQLYRAVRRNLNMSQTDLTVSFNSDVSPTFQSSRSSVWPIQLVINELPPRVRWNNVIVCGLWFAQVHPPVHLFLSAFVQQFVSIGSIIWKTLNRVVKSNVYAVCCIADSPARASILNRKQFNGYYGCSWCLKRGEMVDGALKYAADKDEVLVERTHNSVLKAMKLAVVRKRDVDGMKGLSPLVQLKGLDLVWGVPPDYMHCLLLGVTKHLAELWVSSVGEVYYIGRKLHLINNRLCAIKPPTSFTRLPRCLSEIPFWKASEWRSWLLYYMLPTLNGILPPPFLSHASLLTQGLFLLLQTTVTEADIAEAEQLFRTFAYDAATLYGEGAVRFNTHQLLHLAKSVRMLGPLWATSMFPFEGANGKVLSLVSAAKGVPLQIAERLVMKDTLDEMTRSVPLSGQLKAFAERLLNAREKGVDPCGLGAARCDKQLSDIAMRLLYERMGKHVSVEHYLRAFINGCVIHTSDYAGTERTRSCYVKMRDGSFCEVKELLLFWAQSQEMALLCKRLIIAPAGLGHASHIYKCDRPPASEGLCMYLHGDVESQVVFVAVEQQEYICEQPNVLERD